MVTALQLLLLLQACQSTESSGRTGRPRGRRKQRDCEDLRGRQSCCCSACCSLHGVSAASCSFAFTCASWQEHKLPASLPNPICTRRTPLMLKRTSMLKQQDACHLAELAIIIIPDSPRSAVPHKASGCKTVGARLSDGVAQI